MNFYTKHLKGLTPGDYKMRFDIQNKEPVIKRFTVKDKEAEIRQSLKQIPKMNILGNLFKQLSIGCREWYLSKEQFKTILLVF